LTDPQNLLKRANVNAPLSKSFDAILSESWKRDDIGSEEGFESIEFKSGDDCLLKGWTYRTPGQSNERGTCILLHGIRTNSGSLVDSAKVLSREYNMTMLAFDHRYHGWSSRSPHYPTFGCYESFDAQAAMDFAVETGLPGPFILHGTSLGGMAAQRAGIVDNRVAGLFLLSTPGWAWHAIGNAIKPFTLLTPLANIINAAYGWDVLSDGDIRKHKQDNTHRPLVCYVMGDRDSYNIDLTKQIFPHWHGGEPGEFCLRPSEAPECRRFFYSVEGAIHPDRDDGYFVWDWRGFKLLEQDFFETALGNST
jgi:pimeloyl-ACP methyl ester carboxylesterase